MEKEYSLVSKRCCLHYLHANLKSKGYKGKVYKDGLWATTIASNHINFDIAMNSLEIMSPDMYKDLGEIDPSLWSRHAFGVEAKIDMLTNNLAESFNA